MGAEGYRERQRKTTKLPLVYCCSKFQVPSSKFQAPDSKFQATYISIHIDCCSKYGSISVAVFARTLFDTGTLFPSSKFEVPSSKLQIPSSKLQLVPPKQYLLSLQFWTSNMNNIIININTNTNTQKDRVCHFGVGFRHSGRTLTL